ncbi:MAG: hypothetical protein DBX59_04345 [Bacillota bacterium]|nr:MAG: hypothetical protein DBX59_04345 [Bacillota bacterium]
MTKELYFAELYEQYKNLLNPHRRKLVYEYYILDLSLGEIAEGNESTRQSVNDGLKKARAQLSELESALHMAEKFARLGAFGEKLKRENPSLYEEFSALLKD